MKKTSPAMVAGMLIIILLVAAALGVGIHSGIRTRVEATGTLVRDNQQSAVPLVSVEHPQSIAPSQELVLPGNAQAFVSAPIYARTNGYLKRWYLDIGEHVKSGQLLAEIDSPEIDQQLAQARADLATAEANLRLARITAERYQNLLKTDSVAKQDVDEKIGDRDAKQAVADSAAANVKRLLDTQGFEKVVAPFDGVITARKIDVGNLIDSGANSAGKELFDLAAIDKLRVFVNVPEVNSQVARPGVQVDLTLEEFPGRRFRGTVARTADVIDPTSRTLLTEVDYDNSRGDLLPGSYVQAHLKLPSGGTTVTVPVGALLFRAEGLRVGVFRASRAELIPVTLGRDFGTSVEVVAGLHTSDWVIANPADSLTSGTPVRMVETKVEQK
jgi:RND family efflux transporter MFP subunit